MSNNNSTNTDLDTTSDTEPATKHDVGIGGGLGAVGGAVVGALAGGPVGAVIGAIAGGIASAGAVDVVDKHDHDYERTTGHDPAAVTPATVDTDDTVVDTTAASRATEYTGPGDYQRTQATPIVDNYAGTTDSYTDTTASTARTADTGQTVQLHAEELHASTQPVQTGEVTLHKEVITENRSIDVPVTREEVVIERHAVSGTATTADFGSATDEVIRVPVMEEQVTIEKTPIVTEEISLGKRQVTETQHVTDTVRHEEVRIENTGDVDVLDKGTQSR